MRAAILAVMLALWGFAAVGQELSALARMIPAASSLRVDERGVEMRLTLSQPVPWRVRLMADPPRLVVDMREVDWSGLPDMRKTGVADGSVRAGVVRPGWSRLVVQLPREAVISVAEMETGADTAVVHLRLDPATPEAFAAAAALTEPPEWALPRIADLPKPLDTGSGPVVVVVDPGHGGIDPGAERGGHSEAQLMLTFARELKELLVRDGGFLVILTREEDVFVPLEARISIARAAGAHVFISLHADAITEGEAVGATIYTLSDEASDEAAQTLAERHDRDDLLSGVDLTAQDDLVATVLMDMARTETQPRIDRLAAALVASIKGAGLRMHRHPHQTGGFSVLKSPDIPSVLIELGFLSSERDLARLSDPEWRAKMATALRDGLSAWVAEDAAMAALRRQ